MNKYLSTFLLLLTFALVGCSDDKDEPINTVFAFASTDSNISITNNGTNAVVNVTAGFCEIKIPLKGTFINTQIDSPSKWVKASITDKVLTLNIDANFGETLRSANVAIKANDQAEIVLANLAVNQSAPTTEDYDKWQSDDVKWVVESEGGAHNIPSDVLEKNVWYKLNEDGSAFFRLVNRENNSEPIKVGDVVYPNFSVCTIEQMLYNPNQWWMDALYTNSKDYQPLTVSTSYTQDVIDVWGKGILATLKAPIMYGDDVDIIMTSYNGIPKFFDTHTAYVYVVQFYKTPGNKPNPNNAPKRIIR